MTPRQTCPRPSGFGRNLRSKTRWFTGFCNSHQVSHFATFFIDAGAEISVAESRSVIQEPRATHDAPRTMPRESRHSRDSFPWRIPRRDVRYPKRLTQACVVGKGTRRANARAPGGANPSVSGTCSQVCFAGLDNDPSAGSPTETLLRLLLPLNDKVQWTSRDVAGSEPPTSPRSEHFTGPFNR